jgi:hypothetical protein
MVKKDKKTPQFMAMKDFAKDCFHKGMSLSETRKAMVQKYKSSESVVKSTIS